MNYRYFHDLPVYRISRDRYRQELERRVADFVEKCTDEYTTTRSIRLVRTGISEHYWKKDGSWRFNEIVGYIRLHILGNYVGGTYFSSVNSRCAKTRTKVYLHCDEPFPAGRPVPLGVNNSEILAIINQYVGDCRKRLHRRYLDDEWLDCVGPMVDWNTIIQSSLRR